jgi:hypothetical protein
MATPSTFNVSASKAPTLTLAQQQAERVAGQIVRQNQRQGASCSSREPSRPGAPIRGIRPHALEWLRSVADVNVKIRSVKNPPGSIERATDFGKVLEGTVIRPMFQADNDN